MNALALVLADDPRMRQCNLSLLDSVPPRHGVAVLNGGVVVYDECALHREDRLEDGGYYVVEYQRSRSGSPFAGSRVDVEREVVQVFAWKKPPHLWGFRHSRSSFVSGPIEEFRLTDIIVGKVVGLFRTSAVQ